MKSPPPMEDRDPLKLSDPDHNTYEFDDKSDDEEDPDPADALLERGALLRKLRQLEQEDETARTRQEEANDEPNEHKAFQESIVTLSNGISVLKYQVYLDQQLYYDDLKHVDCRYLDYRHSLLPLPDNDTSSKSLPDSLVVEQDKSLGKGGLCWDAAFILADHLIQLKQQEQQQQLREDSVEISGMGPSNIVNDRNSKNNKVEIVVELGCGTGVCGLLLAKVLDAHVTLTDLPQLLPLIRRNVSTNFLVQEDASMEAGVLDETLQAYYEQQDGEPLQEDASGQDWRRAAKGTVDVSVLDWLHPQDADRLLASTGPVDLILGADVVATLYDPMALVQTIYRLANPATRVYISFKERLSTLHRQFEQAMEERFNIEIVKPISRNRNPDVRILVARNKKAFE